MQQIIFVNQYVTHLFVDIINDFENNDIDVILVTGSIHSSTPISDHVKIRKFISYNRNNAFTRLLTWNLFGVQVFFYLLFQNKPVFLTTNPPFLPVLGWIYHKLRKQPFHVLYYDLYPEALKEMKYLGSGNPAYRCWNSLNKKIIRDTSTVFTISEHLRSGLQKQNKTNRAIHVIHPWADNDFIKPIDKRSNAFIQKQKLEDKLIILYSGNLGLTHSVESILHTAYRLQPVPNSPASTNDISWVIIGEGAKKKFLIEFVRGKKLGNVLVLPWQSNEMLPYTFGSADIGIITLGKGAEGLSVPSKTYNYLAAGSALLAIADKESEMGSLIKKYNCGEIFDPEDIDGITGFILKMKNNPEILSEYKERSRKASFEFGKENAEKFYKIIFKEN